MARKEILYKDGQFILPSYPSVSSGALPSSAEYTYEGITTTAVEKWLQSTINASIKVWNDEHDRITNAGGSTNYRKINMDEIPEISLYSVIDYKGLGDFSPFCLVFSSDFVKKKRNQNNKHDANEEPTMSAEFLNGTSGQKIEIHPAIWSVVERLCYYHTNEKLPKSLKGSVITPIESYIRNAKNQFGADPGVMRRVMQKTKVREIKLRGGNNMIGIVIDPLLVLHAYFAPIPRYMNVKGKDGQFTTVPVISNENYRVIITKMRRISYNNVAFDIKRTISLKQSSGNYDKAEFYNIMMNGTGINVPRKDNRSQNNNHNENKPDNARRFNYKTYKNRH